MKKILSIVVFLSLAALALAQPAAIINEWSQGPSGNQEWVEILVVQDNLNMHNWKLTDQYVGAAGVLSTAYIQFSSPVFYSVPAGTIIVVYNFGTGNRDPAIPVVSDTSWVGDHLMIIPGNDAHVTNGGSWISFNNGATSWASYDSPILKDSTGAIVHDWDNGNDTTFTSIHPVGGANQTRVAYYTGNTAAGVSTASNWTVPPGTAIYTTIFPTPGAGNGGINSAWIASLQGGSTPPTINGVSYVGTLNPAPNTPVGITADVSGTTTPTINLQYRTGGSGAYTAIAMTNSSGTTWTANIPGQPDGTLVDYYVDATNTGSSTVRLPSADYHYRVYGSLLTNTQLVVNEIMYNRSSPLNHAEDWIELYNNTNNTIDLSYFQMMDAITRSYTLPLGTTIASHGYYILAYTASVFTTDYPTVPSSIVGPSFTFELSSPGDSVRIFDPNGNAVNFVPYTTSSPWPTAATGYSIELTSPNVDNSVPGNWQLSTTQYGTPGAVNGGTDVTPPTLNSASATNRFLVVAHWSEPLLSGPANTVGNFGLNGGINLDSSRLALNGTDVNLYVNHSTPLVSGTTYTVTANNIADASSNVSAQQQTSFLWTAPPLPPVMITEIMYNPSNPGSVNEQLREWFEVYNTTASPIDLNGWRIQLGTQANTYSDTIQTDLTIGAGQYMIFSNNADTLLAVMGITSQANYNGNGALANSGTPHIILWNASNALDDSVMYATTSPWPASTNGKSIYLTDYNNDNDAGASWALSTVQMANGDYGTPGLPATGLTAAPAVTSPADAATNQEFSLTIQWSASASASSYIMQYATDNVFTTPTTVNVSGTSQAVSGLTGGMTYYVRVRGVFNSDLSPWSTATSFSTRAPYVITVTAPTAGANWTVGSAQFVNWTDTGMPMANGFFSSDSGVTWTQFFGPVANVGFQSFNAPFTPSTNCYVKITSGSGEVGMSGRFTISDYSFTFTAPLGGEAWMAGSQQTISWTDNGVPTVSIFVSSDSGATWSPIASSIANNDSVQWTLPNTPSTNCYLKLVAPTTAAQTISGRFSITPQLPPSDPTGLTISVVLGSGDASLTWPAVPGATSYTVYSTQDQSTSWSVISSLVFTNGFTDAGAVTSGHRLYRVTANN